MIGKKIDRILYHKRTRHCKDPYYQPKNKFQAKPREYYESLSPIKLTDEQKEKLKKIWEQPQERVNPEDYAICVACTKSQEKEGLCFFIKSIAPSRRFADCHYIFLVKKKPNNLNFKGNYRLNLKTKDFLLPVIFQAIDNGTL